MRLTSQEVARLLGGKVVGPNQVSAPMKGHSNRDLSLSVHIDDTAPEGFVVTPFAGESFEEARDYVRDKLGLPQWQPEKKEKKPDPKVISRNTYVYKNADGTDYLQVKATRYDDGSKSFAQFRWDDDALGWVKGKPDGPKIPYGLPEILANPDDLIFIVEGEKAVNALRQAGILATTSSEGAGKWTADLNQWFAGRDVIVIPDNDAVGRKHARTICENLPHAILLDLQDRAPKAGADDWLASGHTADELVRLALDPPPPPDTTAHDEDGVIADDGAELGRLAPTPFKWSDPADVPRLEWLYGRHLVRRYVSTTIAPGGLGKSSLIQAEALAMSSGRAFLGERIPHPLRVWYWSGEDGQEDNLRRTVAAATHHKLHPSDFSSRLWQDSGREKEIMIATGERGGFTVNVEVEREITAHIIANQIDVLIIDPFVTVHSVSENDNGAINAVVSAFRRIAEHANCAIELVHHIRKPGAGVTTDTDANDARGASALIGGVRSARVLNAMSEAEAETHNIENRFSYFRVDNGKSNLAPRSDKSSWFHILGFEMGNGTDDQPGDNVGVVEKWELPGLFSGLPHDIAKEAQRFAHGGAKRYDLQSPDWFGYAIAPSLKLDPTDKNDAARIKKLVDKWIETGVLLKEIRPDGQRKPKTFIIPGEAVILNETQGF